MFKGNILKAKIVEKGMSVSKLCDNIGICETTFYRKVRRNGDFSRCEIEKISNTLELSNSEKNNIFLAVNLRKRKKTRYC